MSNRLSTESAFGSEFEADGKLAEKNIKQLNS